MEETKEKEEKIESNIKESNTKEVDQKEKVKNKKDSLEKKSQVEIKKTTPKNQTVDNSPKSNPQKKEIKDKAKKKLQDSTGKKTKTNSNKETKETKEKEKEKEKKKKKLGDTFIAQSSPLFNAIFTGKRKTAIARVHINKKNSDIFLVNKIPFDVYFSRKLEQQIVKQALILIGVENKYGIYVNVRGGGKTGQAEAIRLGLARAFSKANTEFHKVLRTSGLLTRDSRIVERKKYGFRKARRGVQFSKR